MDILDGINGAGGGSLDGFNFIFKILFLVVVIGYILYSFFLTLRVRIIADTVESTANGFVKSLSYVHLVAVIGGGFLALILILLS